MDREDAAALVRIETSLNDLKKFLLDNGQPGMISQINRRIEENKKETDAEIRANKAEQIKSSADMNLKFVKLGAIVVIVDFLGHFATGTGSVSLKAILELLKG